MSCTSNEHVVSGGNFGEWTVHRIYRASTQGLTYFFWGGGGCRVGRGQGPKLTIKDVQYMHGVSPTTLSSKSVRSLAVLFYFHTKIFTVHVQHLNNNIVRNCQSFFVEKNS